MAAPVKAVKIATTITHTRPAIVSSPGRSAGGGSGVAAEGGEGVVDGSGVFPTVSFPKSSRTTAGSWSVDLYAITSELNSSPHASGKSALT